MKKEIINSIPVLTFSLFSHLPRLKCYAFTKENGNLSLSEKDKESRKKILDALTLDRFYEVNQVHGDALSEWNDLKDSDGIYTNKTNVPILIRTGDCQAAVFFDPKKEALAVVHAGWRGQEQKIYSRAILKLHEKYGTDAKDLFVAIGPSIGAESFEFKENAPAYMHKHHIGNNHYDLKKAALHELLEMGVLESRIEIAEECTYKDENFHSHRRDKTLSRQGVLAWISN